MNPRSWERAWYPAAVTSSEACALLYPRIVVVGQTCKNAGPLASRQGSGAHGFKQSSQAWWHVTKEELTICLGPLDHITVREVIRLEKIRTYH